jgi:hypoxanthine-DNA glycosylase
MREKHPFPPYVPRKSRYLLLGSFPGKKTPENTWYYGTKRTQIWKILSEVYGKKLDSLSDKKQLFTDLHLALSDVILECVRTKDTNLDNNLKIVSYNEEAINLILSKNRIEKIFFSSRFVENIFRKKFIDLVSGKKIELITLPSPSPRYAKLTLIEKQKRYRELLPKIDN